MQPRSDLIQQFSTFLSFEGDRDRAWTVDPRLRRSMTTCLAAGSAAGSSPNPSEIRDAPDEESTEPGSSRSSGPNAELHWSLYWHHRWQALDSPHAASRLAADHLTAYLQEACFWAAYKISRTLQTAGKLSDLFQEAIARTPKVLKGFNPQVGQSLRRYGEWSFANLIRDHLRQSREIDACTRWSLLHRTSRKRLTQALTLAGIVGNLQRQYLLAWDCYCELHVPRRDAARKLTRPEDGVWREISLAYGRASRDRGFVQPLPTPSDIERWLLAAVQAIRAYQTPTAVSLDAPLGGEGDTQSGSFYDVLPAGTESPMDRWMAAETQLARQTQRQALGAVLQGAIAQLKPEEQALLQAYYGEGLRQRTIAEKLGIKQYSISRKLSRVRQVLLKALLQWTLEGNLDNFPELKAQTSRSKTLHSSPEPSVLDSMGSSLEDWLLQHYQL